MLGSGKSVRETRAESNSFIEKLTLYILSTLTTCSAKELRNVCTPQKK